MTLVNVDTHVDPDPKTRISEAENFMGRSTPSPAACVHIPHFYAHYILSYLDVHFA